MDKELQKVTNELCDLLRPVNIKLEKWIPEGNQFCDGHIIRN